MKNRLNIRTKLSLVFLLKWLVIAVAAGTVGSVLVHSFTFLINSTTDFFSALPVPLPVWTMLGAFLVGGIVYKLEPKAMGEGIPSYLQGVKKNNGVFAVKETWYTFLAALCTLGTFGNGGIVGPLGRVSAGIMSFLGKSAHRLGFSPGDVKLAAVCGLSATVGTIFHSSVGGGVFAVEILQKHELRYSYLFPSIMASSVAVYICKAFGWGTFYPMNPVNEFMDVFIIGWILLISVLTGALGWAYNNLYAVISRQIKRDTVHNILVKVVVGSIVAAWIGWLVNPNILGTSRRLVYSLFSLDKSYLIGNLDFGIPFALLLLIVLSVKALGNCITVGSGMSAGFTGPTVIIGMLLGASVATIIGVSNGHANYYACVAAGFAGMLAGSMNVPLAAAIITIECFGLQYSFPAGIAAVVGFQINRFNTIYDYAIKSESR